jgi:menaquinol-cytochrome c reductase iron-sulfur subunit
LTPGTPKLISIVGNRQDAWTEFPQETIGRVWVVRRTDADTPPKETKLDVYSAVCPHLGCTIQLDDDGESFVCPCHMAFFDLSGETYSAEQLARRLDRNDDVKNPAPRDMDPLESEASNLVQDKATGQWWVEVAYQRFQAGIAERIPVT